MTTDSISQTFYVDINQSEDTVVFVDKIDLFFYKKPSSGLGVTVQIVDTVNGYPGPNILPFSKYYLTNAAISASSTNALTPTTVTFSAPVPLKTGAQYAVMLIPDASSPDFGVWTSVLGQSDIDTGNAITSSTFNGSLFTSTNGLTWNAYQNEVMKINIYKKEFTTSSGSMYLTNKDTEFLSIQTSSRFQNGELVGVLNANLTGTLTMTIANNIVTGSGFSVLSAGDYIGVHDTYGNTAIIDILHVQSVANDAYMVIDGYAKHSNTAANYFKTTVGTVSYFNNTVSPVKLFLDNSSANPGTTNVFKVSDTIFGVNTLAQATIISVDDLNVSYIQPNIYRTTTTNTTASLLADILENSSHTNYATTPLQLPFNSNSYLNKTPTVIQSYSNRSTTNDAFRLRIDLNNTSSSNTPLSTPFVDFDISNVTVYENLINNTANNGTVSETDGNGDGPALTKYISKTVQLADGLDASDLKVYLTAYRPPGTDIQVYGRFQNVNDPRAFNTIEWSLLTPKSETLAVSSTANLFDYKEIEYDMPTQLSTAFSAGSGAALNINNNNVIRYISPDGIIYDTYKYFAIKIVLLSSTYASVPKVKNMRGIALT